MMNIHGCIVRKSIIGFTLVELLVTVGIIGTLAAVAMPRMFVATSYAQNNSMIAVAGMIQQAASTLHAGVISGSIDPSNAITDCSQTGINGLFDAGALPSGYSITNAAAPFTASTGGTPGAVCVSGNTSNTVCSCTLTGTGTPVTFNIVTN